MNKKGVLLLNIGTPDNCDKASVFRYLKQFLSDPRVIDLPKLIRWPLVNWVILPFRYKKSAKAYQKIWLKEGSPLLVYTLQLKETLTAELGNDYQIEVGMRYGNPSIKTAYEKLKNCENLIVLPLFPQYSSAATGSAIGDLLSLLSQQWNIPKVKFNRDFYNYSGFISAYAEVIQKHISNKKLDYLLFSYHGLPERHIYKSECEARCNSFQTCPKVEQENRYCYRAQCFETSRLLAKALDLKTNQFSVTFQSRLGRTPWIKPYTDVFLPKLIQQGIKNIAIVCPSFVSDCLETLEEINIRAREQWLTLGGCEFTFIPCLNTQPTWIKALAEIVKKI